MDKMAGRDLFEKMDEMDAVIKDIGNMLGQLTRVKDPGLVNNIAKTLRGILNGGLDKAETLSYGVEELKNVVTTLRAAEKGMPNPAAGRDVAEIQRLLDVISEKGKAAKKDASVNYGDRHGMSYGSSKTSEQEDAHNARKDFRKATMFKRNPMFSPTGPLYGDRLPK
jgi:hypothetical protein